MWLYNLPRSSTDTHIAVHRLSRRLCYPAFSAAQSARGTVSNRTCFATFSTSKREKSLRRKVLVVCPFLLGLRTRHHSSAFLQQPEKRVAIANKAEVRGKLRNRDFAALLAPKNDARVPRTLRCFVALSINCPNQFLHMYKEKALLLPFEPDRARNHPRHLSVPTPTPS